MFQGGALEVDAGRVHGFVAHQVGQQDQVVVLGKEVLGEQVPERMRMDDRRVDSVFLRQLLEVLRDTARSYLASVPVDKQVSGVPVDPRQEFRPQPDRQVDPSDFPAFRVDVVPARSDMLGLELDQFADPGSGRRQGPYDEIPPQVLFA